METASHLSSDGERIPELGESDVLFTVVAPGTSAVSDTNGGSSINLDTSYLTDVKDEHLEEKSCASAFEEFISACTLCLKLPEEERIIERLRKHYNEINQNSLQNEELYSSLKNFTSQIRKKSDCYIIIQEVINSFKSLKAKSAANEINSAHIKRLEKYLGFLDKKIKKLQAQEVNLEDENNSIYILEDKYITKFNKIHNKLCELHGSSRVEPKAKIDYNGTRYPEINKNISKYLRKYSNEFPDYPTILTIIEETNETSSLHLSEESISQMARDVFEAIGTQLKKRRLEDFTFTLGCYLTDSIQSDDSNDPAEVDHELKKKLEENSRIGKKRIDEVMEKYVIKQEARVNEATENGSKSEGSSNSNSDEEDTESVKDDVESEDEDGVIQLSESSSSEHVESDMEKESGSPSKEYVCLKSTSVHSNGKEIKCEKPISNGFTVFKSTSQLVDCDTKIINFNEYPSSRAMKRERSPVDHDMKQTTVKRRVVVEQIIDDDVIVLSD